MKQKKSAYVKTLFKIKETNVSLTMYNRNIFRCF